jgi:hypothetical protein
MVEEIYTGLAQVDWLDQVRLELRFVDVGHVGVSYHPLVIKE